MKKVYAWRRFWVPDNTDLLLDSEAYLPNPEEKYAQFVNRGVSNFAEICLAPCIILLGEPGMGKSLSLRADFEELAPAWVTNNEMGVLIDLGALTSLTDLRTHLCENGVVRRWTAGNGLLHLCLDSLDEALPVYPGLPKALVGVIGEFPKDRLRLSIACRAGELPPYLENELSSHFGVVSKWHMAPLRRKDIQVAATENGLDGDGFLEAVGEREVQPLAARPITLDLLLDAAVSGSELLSDIWLLYKRGCQRLLCEPSDSSRFTQPQRMDLDQKMAVAGRIACVTIFGAYSAVDIEPNAPTQSGFVASKDIGGGQEAASGNPFPVNDLEIQDVLKTGLFTASGLRFRWFHKSYAEFLAAHHLLAHEVSRNQIMSLIGCAGQVAPALRGVAAWLTARAKPVFQQVLRADPEVLLFSDLSTAADQQKAEIVTWLLGQAESNSPLVQEWELHWTYRKLKHAALNEQLRVVIEGSTSLSARHCAIQMALACGGVGLQCQLTDLALRSAESLTLRVAAVSFVADHGDGSFKARLLPLALQAASNGEEERLQAEALLAVWPEHCTWGQLRDSLGSGDQSTTTPLGRFLAFDFAEGLPASDLSEALSWSAQRDWPPHGLSAWAIATDKLLTKAATGPLHSDLRRAVVDVLFGRLSRHHEMFADSGGEAEEGISPWPADARKAIAADLIPRLARPGYAVVTALRCSNPLLSRDDVGFAIERWKIASDAEKSAWQTVIGFLVDWQDVQHHSAVLAQALDHQELHLFLEQWQDSIRSNVDRERLYREGRAAQSQCNKDDRALLIHDLLDKAAIDSRYFSDLLYTMGFPLGENYAPGVLIPGLRELPGWQVLTDDERARLLTAGKRFLNEGRPYIFRGLRNGGPTKNSATAYRILRELVASDAAYLRDLSTATWDRWTPAIILFQCDLSEEHYGDADRKLVNLAAAKSEGSLIRTLGIILRTRQVFGAERELMRLSNVLPPDAFDAAVYSCMLRHRVPPNIYLAGMRMLLRRSHKNARGIVEEAAEKVPLARDDELPRLALNSVLWLEQDAETAWPVVRQQMTARPAFAPLLLNVPGQDGSSFRQIAGRLSDEQLVDLYFWLRGEFGIAQEVLASTTRPEWASQGTILANLQQRRSASSVAALEHIAMVYPDDWYVRKAAWDGKRLLVEASWEPLQPATIKRMIEDRKHLLVRDERELMEAVWSALHDYQIAIRAEGSRVMRLWNEPAYTPKPEEPLSREISDELQRILNARGVRVALEPKIRDTQFADIYVSAVTSNSKQRMLSLIIEVKGCWHEELRTALETQLAMRYLKESESRLGIYIAVWFLCEKWDGTLDTRKGKTPHTSRSAIRTFLEQQARDVGAETQSTIRAFVLDATIEGPAKRSRSARHHLAPKATRKRSQP